MTSASCGTWSSLGSSRQRFVMSVSWMIEGPAGVCAASRLGPAWASEIVWGPMRLPPGADKGYRLAHFSRRTHRLSAEHAC